MGSPAPFEPDFARIEERMARPAVLEDLRRLGIEHPLALFATQMFVNTKTPTALFRDAVVNSDFRPYLEYRAPIGFFTGSAALGIRALDMRSWAQGARTLWIDRYEPSRAPTRDEFALAYREKHKAGSLYADQLVDWARRWHGAYPDDPRAVEAWIATHPERRDWQRDQLREAVRRFPDDGDLADLHARVLFRLLDENGPEQETLLVEAREAIERAIELNPGRRVRYAVLLLPVAYSQRKMDEVLALGPKVIARIDKVGADGPLSAPHTLLRMICEAAVARGRNEVADYCLEQARRLLPDDVRVRRLEGIVETMKRRQGEIGQ
jgi:hypothetical protein